MPVDAILKEAALDTTVADRTLESSHNPIQVLVQTRDTLAMDFEPMLFVILSDITKVSLLTSL